MDASNEMYKTVIEELNTLVGSEHIPTLTVVEGLKVVENDNTATVTLNTNHGLIEMNVINERFQIRIEQLYLDIDSSYLKEQSLEDIMDGVLSDISAMFKRKNRLNSTYKKHGFFKK